MVAGAHALLSPLRRCLSIEGLWGICGSFTDGRGALFVLRPLVADQQPPGSRCYSGWPLVLSLMRVGDRTAAGSSSEALGGWGGGVGVSGAACFACLAAVWSPRRARRGLFWW